MRSGEKRAGILDAAQTVIARQGYHGAKISEIAAEAGVAAGTVYLYFANKPDLLVSLFRDRLALLIENARSSVLQSAGPAEKVSHFIHSHLRSLARMPELAQVTQIELRQADLSVQREISLIMKGYFQVLDDVIAEGQEAGIFKRVEPRQIRNVVFGALDQTVTAWVMSGCRFDMEALAAPTCDLIMGGLIETSQGGTGTDGDPGAAQANI